MGQTLENSIYLPDEGETNCYSGLASNWRALDTLKGNYSLHAINVDIHVTAAEKETWNGKADSSALTAHTGDTTIHVTAEDKAKWDAVTSKADDSDVVHKSGNETINGNKTFSSINGAKPSSLSLPSGNANDVIDISSYITDLRGNANNYTAPANGWISITMRGCSGVQAYIAGLWGHQVTRPSVGDVRFLMPILKNLTASIFIFGGTIDNARFIPCQGNI